MFSLAFKPLDVDERHRCFDVIRGIAVLLVVFAHLDNYQALMVWPISYQPIQGHIGQLGVHLFFILSGALIWLSAKNTLHKPDGWTIYAINRITRITPLYLASILFIVLAKDCYIGRFKPTIDLETLTWHLFFLQSYKPSLLYNLNSVFWTLTYEMTFYLIVPLLLLLKPKPILLAAGTALVLILLSNFPTVAPSFFSYWILFAAGILIIETSTIPKPWFSVWLLLVATALFTAQPKLLLAEQLFAIACFMVMINFKFQSGVFKPVAFVGVISYSIYIWHAVLIHLVLPYLGKPQPILAPQLPFLPFGISIQGVFIVTLIMLVAYTSYRIIEKPSMNRLRMVLQRRLVKR